MVPEKLENCVQNSEPRQILYILCKSKTNWIINLNVKLKNIKLAEENIGKKLVWLCQ